MDLIYTGTQYIGLAFLTPVFTSIIITFGWNFLFYITGIVGIIIGLVWYVYYRNSRKHMGISQEELNYIKDGDGLFGTEEQKPFSWRRLGLLLKDRQILGMFIGQFSIMTTLFLNNMVSIVSD
ncbi:MAG: MFS transporter [Bacillota bacterium]